MAFIEKASSDLLVEARESNSARLRLEAYSALETTLGVLEEFRSVGGALHSPSEGWADPLTFANYQPGEGRTVEITFEDESGKFSLPNVQALTLNNLFQSWELTQANAEKLTDALLGWMKKDYVPTGSGVRPEVYEEGSLPFDPPARSLRSFSELQTIEYAREIFYDEAGKPNELWARFQSAFSLYDYKTANLNGANPEMMAGLGVTDLSQQKVLNDYLKGTGKYETKGPGYFKNAGEAGAILGIQSPVSQMGTEIRALRIIVTVHEGQLVYRLNTVIAPKGGAKLAVTSAPTQTTQEGAKTTANEDASSKSSSTSKTSKTPPKAGSSGSNPNAKKLNYPFTLLEIRENDEIPQPSPAAVTP
jgi:general secretion pathway protein K